MPVRAITNDLDYEAVSFCWRLCQSNSSRSYPLFQSRSSLAREYARTEAHPGAFKAGCYQKGVLKGAVFGFAEHDEHYLQTTGFYTTDIDLAALLADWLSTRFKGYTANIGLSAENRAVSDALRLRNYQLQDDALDLRLYAADFRAAAPSEYAVDPVTADALPRYLKFHQTHFGDCYWNAQRLRERFRDWYLYALETNGAITGGLFMRKYADDAVEVYGLHAETESAATALLSRAIADLLKGDAALSSVLFMADTADSSMIAAALSLGFRQENHYRCYAKTL